MSDTLTREQIEKRFREWAKRLNETLEAWPHLKRVELIEVRARALWNEAVEECAKECERLWNEEAQAAIAGTEEPKYHDMVEGAFSIRALKIEEPKHD